MSKKDDAFWGQAFDPDAPLAKTGKPWKSLGKDTPKSLPLLVDGDIIAYRAAAPCDGKYYSIVDDIGDTIAEERYKKEIDKAMAKLVKTTPSHTLEIQTKFRPEPEAFAIYNVDKMMASLLEKYPNAWVRTYLTGNTNFRAEMNPEYKANRKGIAKPIHLNACKQHLLNRYTAAIQDLYEADDLIGIAAMEMHPDREYRICTIDKDLNCIPGGHWNFVKGEEYDINEQEALEFFYCQCLTGDKVDNIEGIRGIGPVKGKKIIDSSSPDGEPPNEVDCYLAVLKAWAKSLFPDKPNGEIWTAHEVNQAAEVLGKSAEQLWILQEEGVMWSPPITVDDLFKKWEKMNAMV